MISRKVNKNKKKTIEEQQNIPELIINENGEMLTYTLNGIQLTKHVDNGMYTLESILALFPEEEHRPIQYF